MAYIQPNSIIQFFKGINLDNRYMHTIYFASVSAQNTWFTSKVDKTISGHSYQRYTTDKIKVKGDATDFLSYTYMRFMNDRNIDMWFYAFITGVEYLNENTVLITSEIDVMQTWFIQKGSVRPCMVLREHVTDDVFGHNLEVEPIGSDVYDADEITNGTAKIFGDAFDKYSLVAQTTGNSLDGHHIVQGLFSGCNYYDQEISPTSGTHDIQDDGDTIYHALEVRLGSWEIQQQQEVVVDLYTVPTFCVGNNTGHKSSGQLITIPSTYDNYTPKNKKLFMYPYSYLLLTTHAGDTAVYRWEYFDGTTGSPCQFELDGTMIGGGEVRCYPRAYNGQTDNVDSGIVINNFPKNCANYDAYQAWMAGGGSTRLDNDRLVNSFKGAGAIVNTIGSLLSSIIPSEGTTVRQHSSSDVGTFMGQPFVNQGQSNTVTTHSNTVNVGGISGGVGGAVATVGSLIEAKNNMQYTFNDAHYQPNIVVGKPSSCLPVAQRDLDMYFFHVHIRDDEVKRLDDFLSCYGYQINKVKAPALTGRQYWNFVMTKDCVIAGDMPASSKEAIARIFDTGITFWHNGDNVGNYAISVTNDTINNPIVT